jgi:uncharacterized protein
VRPGSRRERVGGSHDGALIVRVRARAVDQAATEEALALVAEALGVRRSAARVARGAASRIKVFELTGDVARLERRYDELLEGPPEP